MRSLVGRTRHALRRRGTSIARVLQLNLGTDRNAETPGPSLDLTLGERTQNVPFATWVDDFLSGTLSLDYAAWEEPADFIGVVVTEPGIVGPELTEEEFVDSVHTVAPVLPRDQWAEVTIETLTSAASPSGTAKVGVGLRLSPPTGGTGRGYLVRAVMEDGVGLTVVERFNAGTATTLDSIETPWHAGETLRATIEWRTIRVYRNDVLILRLVDDTPLLFGGRAGISAVELGDSTARLTGFACGPLRLAIKGLLTDAGDLAQSLGLQEPTGNPARFGVGVSNLARVGGKTRFSDLIRHGLNRVGAFDLLKSPATVFAQFARCSTPLRAGVGLVRAAQGVTVERLRLDCEGRDAFLEARIDPAPVTYIETEGLPIAPPDGVEDPCAEPPDPDVIPGDPPAEPPPDAPPPVEDEETEPTGDPFPGIYYVRVEAFGETDDSDYNTSFAPGDKLENVIVDHTALAADYLEAPSPGPEDTRARRPDTLGFTHRFINEMMEEEQIALNDSVIIAGLNSSRTKVFTYDDVGPPVRTHGRMKTFFYRALADLPGTHIEVAIRRKAFVKPEPGTYEAAIINRYASYKVADYGAHDDELYSLREDGWRGTGKVFVRDGVESEGWPYDASGCTGAWPGGHPASPNGSIYFVEKVWECSLVGMESEVRVPVGYMCIPAAYSGGPEQFVLDALGPCPPTPPSGSCLDPFGEDSWTAGYHVEAQTYNPMIGGIAIPCLNEAPSDPENVYICEGGPDLSYNKIWAHTPSGIVVNLRVYPDPEEFEDLETLDIDDLPTNSPLGGTTGPDPESDLIEALTGAQTGGPIPTSSDLDYEVVTFEIGDARLIGIDVEIGNSLANPSTGVPESDDGHVESRGYMEVCCAILRVYTP